MIKTIGIGDIIAFSIYRIIIFITWVCVDYKTIDLHKNFTAVDSFCDENGNNNQDFPGMHWKNEFTETDTGTKVTVEITFSSEANFEKILQMGFEAGFTAALVTLMNC